MVNIPAPILTNLVSLESFRSYLTTCKRFWCGILLILRKLKICCFIAVPLLRSSALEAQNWYCNEMTFF